MSTTVTAKVTPKEARRQKRHRKIRSKLSGTAERPRISVYRSNQHTYVQVIDDENQKTLCAIGTMSPKIKEVVGNEEWKSKTVDAAREVGKALGEMRRAGHQVRGVRPWGVRVPRPRQGCRGGVPRGWHGVLKNRRAGEARPSRGWVWAGIAEGVGLAAPPSAPPQIKQRRERRATIL